MYLMSHWPTVFSIVNSLIVAMSLKENIVHIASKYTSFIGAVGMLLHKRVWRYQRDNQNPYIEEEQRPQWPKEKSSKDKKRSTNNTNKTRKSLKIPKGQSESVYRRRTDNTMAKRKGTKGQTTIEKTYI